MLHRIASTGRLFPGGARVATRSGRCVATAYVTMVKLSICGVCCCNEQRHSSLEQCCNTVMAVIRAKCCSILAVSCDIGTFLQRNRTTRPPPDVPLNQLIPPSPASFDVHPRDSVDISCTNRIE